MIRPLAYESIATLEAPRGRGGERLILAAQPSGRWGTVTEASDWAREVLEPWRLKERLSSRS